MLTYQPVYNQINEFEGLETITQNAVLWLDSTNIDAVTNTYITDNTAISAWVDLTGNGNSATQANAADQPIYSSIAYLNSQPGVTFTDHYLDIDSTLTPGTSARTIILVTAPNTTSSILSLNGDGNASNSGSILSFKTDSVDLHNSTITFNESLDLSNLNIYTARNNINANASDIENFKNGSPLTTSVVNETSISLDDSITRVGGYNTNRFDGILSEILIFDKDLSNDELTRINRYLALKWNLESIVDSDGDTHIDNVDMFPIDPTEWADNDLDGIGDNADPDDDNDNYSDQVEEIAGTLHLDENSVPSADFTAEVDHVLNESSGFESIEANLELWLDASNTDASQNISLTDGVTINAWVDLTGNGFNGVQETADYQPIFSENSIIFDGVDDALLSTSTINNTTLTVVTVWELNSTSNSQIALFLGETDLNKGLGSGFNGADGYNTFIWEQQSVYTGLNNSPKDQTNIQTSILNSGNLTLNFNGATIMNISGSVPEISAGISIGKTGSFNSVDGNFKEILILIPY